MQQIQRIVGKKKVVARQGERTIKLSIKFRTDEIGSNGSGEITPKHAWDCGIVNVVSNKSHGIKAELEEKMCFNSMAELPAVIERTLELMGVTLHHLHTRALYAPTAQEYVRRGKLAAQTRLLNQSRE